MKNIKLFFGLIISTSVTAQVDDSLGNHCWQQAPFSQIICFEVNANGQYFSLIGENIVDGKHYPLNGSALLDKQANQFRMSFTQNLGGEQVFENTVTLDPATLSGTWNDDGGNSGEFQYLGVGPLAPEKIETVTTRRATPRKNIKKHCPSSP